MSQAKRFIPAIVSMGLLLACGKADKHKAEGVPAPEVVPTPTLKPNSKPQLQALPSMTGKVGEDLSFTLKAVDPDQDALHYSCLGEKGNCPIGLRISAQGQVDWRPDLGQAGVYQLRFAVSDGRAWDMQALSLTVKAGNPQANGIEVTSTRKSYAFAGRALELPLELSGDPLFKVRGQNLTCGDDVQPCPQGIKLQGKDLLLWTPTEAQIGTQSFRLSYTIDGQKYVRTEVVQVLKKQKETLGGDGLGWEENVTVIEGGEVAFHAYCAPKKSADPYKVSVYADVGRKFLKVVPSATDPYLFTVQVDHSPAADRDEELTIYCTAPGLYSTLSGTMKLSVLDKNDEPHIYGFGLPGETANKTVAEGGTLTQYINFLDKDVTLAKQLTLTCQRRLSGQDDAAFAVCPNAELNLRSIQQGTITWKPNHRDSGTYDFKITITDDKGAANSSVFVVNVTQENGPPDQLMVWEGSNEVTTLSVKEDVPFTYRITVSDPDQDPVTLTLAEGSCAGQFKAWNTLADGTFSGTVKSEGRTRACELSVSVSDGVNPVVVFKVPMAINNVERPPAFVAFDSLVWELNEGGTVWKNFHFVDPDDEVTAITCLRREKGGSWTTGCLPELKMISYLSLEEWDVTFSPGYDFMPVTVASRGLDVKFQMQYKDPEGVLKTIDSPEIAVTVKSQRVLPDLPLIADYDRHVNVEDIIALTLSRAEPDATVQYGWNCQIRKSSDRFDKWTQVAVTPEQNTRVGRLKWTPLALEAHVLECTVRDLNACPASVTDDNCVYKDQTRYYLEKILP